MANETVGEEKTVITELGQEQLIERALVAPDGTIAIPRSEALLLSVDVADVDLLLNFSDGTFVIIPNGALDAISETPYSVIFSNGDKSTLSDLFKMVGISNHAKAGSLRVVSGNVDATKTLIKEEEETPKPPEHELDTSNDVLLSDKITTTPTQLIKVSSGTALTGKGPGQGSSIPSVQIVETEDPVVPPITPRPTLYRPGQKIESPSDPLVTLDANITADDIINIAEAGGKVAITGSVDGNALPDDIVTLAVNGKTFTGLVQSDKTFSINVAGSDLVADSDMVIDASITTNSTATASEGYTVDITAPLPTITLNTNITADDSINNAESGGDIAITGGVGGDAQVGDTVTLTVNGIDSTGLVRADKTFSINVLGSDLIADADKTIDASISSSDIAGNPGTASTTDGYSVNLTLPVPTITLDSNITADGIINIAEAGGDIAITGRVGGDAQVGDTVTLTVNGVDSRGLVQADNTFSINVAGSDLVADTDRTIDASITTTDTAGNFGTATTTEGYTVDLTAPIPTLTLDANITADDIINIAEAGGNIAITGRVGGDAQVGDTVTLTVNGVDSTGLVQTDNTFSINVAGSDLIADADKTIDANITTTDTAGNPGLANTSEGYAVDLIAPIPTITLDANITGDSIINIAEAGGNIAITGRVGGDAQVGDTVTLTVNSVDSTGLVQADKTFSINVAGSDLIADADQTIDASITTSPDAAGNPSTTGTASAGYNVDIIAPTATIVVDDTALKIGETTNVNITFSEAITGFSNADLNIANGTLTAVTSSDGGITWTATLTPDTPVEDASNVITLANSGVFDLAGNAGSGSTDSGNYAIDTRAPLAPTVALSSDSGVSGDNISNRGTLTLGGIEAGAKVEYSIDGTNNWSQSFSASEGVNTVQVRQTDAAGNVSNAGSLSFELDSTAPTAVTVALGNDSGASGNDKISNDGTLSLSGIEAGASVEYSVDGGVSWNSSFSASEGLNTVVVRQVDVAGNTGNVGILTFTLDTIAPTITVNQIFNYIENQTIGTVVATVAASDDIGITDFQIVGGTGQSNFAIDASGQITLINAAANDYEGTNSFTLNIVASDAAGNTTTQTVTLNVTDVDESAPVVTSGQSFSYAENQTAGAVVATVAATDEVGVSNYRFSDTGTNTSADGFYTIAADG